MSLCLRVGSGSGGDAVCHTHRKNLEQTSGEGPRQGTQPHAPGITSRRPQSLPTGRKEGPASSLGRSALHPPSGEGGRGGEWSAGVPSSVNQRGHPSLPLPWGPLHASSARLQLLTPRGADTRRAPHGGSPLPPSDPAVPTSPRAPPRRLPRAPVPPPCRRARLRPRWVSLESCPPGPAPRSLLHLPALVHKVAPRCGILRRS